MPSGQGTIQLPPVVKLTMPAQHAVTILQALENFGPYSAVNPVLVNVQQQLLSQQALNGVSQAPPRTEPQYPSNNLVTGQSPKLALEEFLDRADSEFPYDGPTQSPPLDG